jgi:hypothetical protein
VKLTPETRAKKSVAMKGRALPVLARTRSAEANKRKARPIICVSDGLKFPSISEASRHYGINVTNICAMCRGRYKSIGGRRFQYLLEEA